MCSPGITSSICRTAPASLALEQASPLGIFVEPLADIPAHRDHAVAGVLLDVIDGELDHFARQTLPAVCRVGVRVVERDLVAVDAVVSRAEQLFAIAQGVSPSIRLVRKFFGHALILGGLALP